MTQISPEFRACCFLLAVSTHSVVVDVFRVLDYVHMVRSADFIQDVVLLTSDIRLQAVAESLAVEAVLLPYEGVIENRPLCEWMRLYAQKQHCHFEFTFMLNCLYPVCSVGFLRQALQQMLRQQRNVGLSVAAVKGPFWQQIESPVLLSVPIFQEVDALYIQRNTNEFLPAAVSAYQLIEIVEPVGNTNARAVTAVSPRQAEILSAQSIPKNLRVIVMDFDGVFTDNRVLVHQSGEESVWCHRGDGWGLSQLKNKGIKLLVLSAEENPVVQARCRKLDIDCLSGIKYKRAALEAWMNQAGIASSEMIYVGNDVNDIDCLRLIACSIVVADAHPQACEAARYQLRAVGGKGALRELADVILNKMEKE